MLQPCHTRGRCPCFARQPRGVCIWIVSLALPPTGIYHNGGENSTSRLLGCRIIFYRKLEELHVVEIGRRRKKKEDPSAPGSTEDCYAKVPIECEYLWKSETCLPGVIHGLRTVSREEGEELLSRRDGVVRAASQRMFEGVVGICFQPLWPSHANNLVYSL